MSMPRLETLKVRIRDDDYAVDAQAVAEAMLSRLLGPGRAPADGGASRRGFGNSASPATG